MLRLHDAGGELVGELGGAEGAEDLDGGQAECGACHGLLHDLPRSQSSRCGDCHPETVIDGGEIVEGALHHVN